MIHAIIYWTGFVYLAIMVLWIILFCGLWVVVIISEIAGNPKVRKFFGKI